jgi:hypothetical protein
MKTKRTKSERDQLRERLAHVMKPEFIPQWLEAPNDSFGGLKPIEVLERGEIRPHLELAPPP